MRHRSWRNWMFPGSVGRNREHQQYHSISTLWLSRMRLRFTMWGIHIFVWPFSGQSTKGYFTTESSYDCPRVFYQIASIRTEDSIMRLGKQNHDGGFAIWQIAWWMTVFQAWFTGYCGLESAPLQHLAMGCCPFVYNRTPTNWLHAKQADSLWVNRGYRMCHGSGPMLRKRDIGEHRKEDSVIGASSVMLTSFWPRSSRTRIPCLGYTSIHRSPCEVIQ